ncbi:beta-1,3-galactosyltransferase 5-like [Drosophila obscura]|uniref:beta-1,3-galactosyltransferase 5-like n=1 Tax=Drosophila obscura TaxID=7282 RepID=UPI001BB259EC|nr:beta-1,3-galactosyltransferase 5-like [Drosophila obscura]
MGNLNTNKLKFFVILSAVILTTIFTIIYASFSASVNIPQKHINSVDGFPMAQNLSFSEKLNGNSSNHHASTIGNQHTERSIKSAEKKLSFVHGRIVDFPALSAGFNQLEKPDIMAIMRRKLIKYQAKYEMKARKEKKSHRSLPFGRSSLQKSSTAPVLPFHQVLTVSLYEPGHLNDEIDKQRQICKHWGSFLKLLILITSAQSHSMERMSIRHTWMHYASRRDVGMAFFLGSTTNVDLNDSLNQENYIYGDMIRGNFIDSYLNLTLKTISMLEWVNTHCPRVKYILKTDDDMFINVPKLLDFIDGHKDKRTIYGRVVEEQEPERNMGSKYFVPYHQFRGAEFPKYTTGGAYLLTGDIVHELYMESLNTYYVQLEDVFTTGIMAESLNINRVHAENFRNVRITLLPCSIRNAISIHMIEPHEQYELWRILLDPTITCQKVWQDADAGIV